MKQRTSKNYLYTVDINSVNDMQTLDNIRKVVKLMNTNSSNKKRVVCRGRKPLTKTSVKNRWTGKTSISGYDFAGNVVGGIKNATMIDVYVYDRH